MKSFLRNNGLSLVLVTIFLVLLVGQAVSGWHSYNQEQQEHSGMTVSLAE